MAKVKMYKERVAVSTVRVQENKRATSAARS
jgi:hypothetical protein